MNFAFDPNTVTVTSQDSSRTDEADRRTLVIREATSWLHTPFRDTQQAKGTGCDCGNFVMGVFGACGWPHQRFFPGFVRDRLLDQIAKPAERLRVARAAAVRVHGLPRCVAHPTGSGMNVRPRTRQERRFDLIAFVLVPLLGPPRSAGGTAPARVPRRLYPPKPLPAAVPRGWFDNWFGGTGTTPV